MSEPTAYPLAWPATRSKRMTMVVAARRDDVRRSQRTGFSGRLWMHTSTVRARDRGLASRESGQDRPATLREVGTSILAVLAGLAIAVSATVAISSAGGHLRECWAVLSQLGTALHAVATGR
jgi:hypothetical protein